MPRSTHSTNYQVINGGATNTTLNLTQAQDVRLAKRDLIAVLRVTTAGAVSDVTSQVKVISTKGIQLTTTTTTGEKLIVIWRHAGGN